jgi:hypothetical protein
VVLVCLRAPVFALLLIAGSCTSQPAGIAADADGNWRGTITTEGNITTVVNESGSVWGGKARLAEEASIGVESGPDEYIFGSVSAVHGTDQHIYVIDPQVNLVRRYDHDGIYIDTIGGIGQGPGEYLNPTAVAVAPDGRILVLDGQTGRTQVFAADGTVIESWLTPGVACCGWPFGFDAKGVAWFPTRKRNLDTFELDNGVRAYGPDGPLGDNIPLDATEPDPPMLSVGGRRMLTVPFTSQTLAWTPAGGPSLLVGDMDEYRFQLQRDGKTIVEVEKYWEPIPIDPDHAEWERRMTVARGRRHDSDWDWNGAEMPGHYPAFGMIVSTSGSGFWVVRFEQPERLSDCVEDPLAAEGGIRATMSNPCWRYMLTFDVFGEDGRFLGEVDTPRNLLPSSLMLHVVGDRVIGVEMDDLGTVLVKRYRLVLPGEEYE